jgi:hypothetical protein
MMSAAGLSQGVNSAPMGAANAVSVGVVHPSARTAVRRALCAPLGAANAVSVGVVQP